MRLSSPLRQGVPWVVLAAVIAALASIVLVTTLQGRADSSRAAQVALAHAERDFDALQSVPYDDAAGGASDAAVVLGRMRRAEDGIRRTIATLQRTSPNRHLVDALRPYRANTAVLERINRLLARGRTLEADALAPVAASLQGAVDGAFEDAADDAARRAVKSQWLATVGSGAATLALLSLFGVFYFRSRKAHAIADRLAAENSQLQLQDSQLQVIHRLALAGEYRDDETGHHTRRVGEISRQIGAALEMPERQLDMLRQAAPLHDVGKIAIPDSVLLKPGPLTSEEFAQMKGHAALGAEMLAGRSFPLMEMAELIALTHHERWDGGGYPAGLAGEDIPLVGRIVAVADVFDALTHSRPYKDAWTVEAAVDLVKDQAGRQFDPAVVEAFMTVVAGFARPGEEEAQIDSPAEGRPASAPPAARAAMPW